MYIKHCFRFEELMNKKNYLKNNFTFKRFKRRISVIYNHAIFKILTGILFLAVISSVLVNIFEETPESTIQNIWQGMWWAFVSITTTGYGDFTPVTFGGRIVGIIVMISGIAVISLLTASISSVFIERQIRKGQGLESVKIKNHFIICGWNFNAEHIITTLEKDLEYPKIVLVNSCDSVQMMNIINHHKESEIYFVSGDFSNETILEKANIRDAEAVIIVSDMNELTSNKADEKTIIATLTIKNMNPKVRLYGQVVNPDNAAHLQRAKADDVVVSDKYSGFLLAMHVSNPGIPRVVDELLSFEYGNEIVRMSIPHEWIGKTFQELVHLFKDEKDAILFGIGREIQSVAIHDLLSDNNSYLDVFIRQKLQESGKKFSEEHRMTFRINPPKDYVTEPNDIAIAIYDKF